MTSSRFKPASITIICLLTAVLFSFTIKSQEHSTKLFTSKDGLPASTIFSVYEDKLGYLWMGTTNGLSRYDGKYFNNYAYQEGLPDLTVTSIFMDSHKRLWVATPNGMGQFRGNRFIVYPLSDSMKIEYVFGITENKGRVWAMTSAGVYEFQKDRWMKIDLYANCRNRRCRNIVEADEGTYINYGNFIVLKKENGESHIISDSSTIAYYYNSMMMFNHQLFVSTIDGICKIEHEHIKRLPGILGRLKDLYSYFFDSKMNCWIGSQDAGLLLLKNKDTSLLQPFYKHPFINLYSGFYEDHAGNLWVADYYGLLKITAAEYKMFTIPAAGGEGLLRNVFQPPGGPVYFNNGTTRFHVYRDGKLDSLQMKIATGNSLPNNEMVIDRYAFDDKGRRWYVLRGVELLMEQQQTLYNQKSRLARLGKEAGDVLFDQYRKKILVLIYDQKYPCEYNDTGFALMPVVNDVNIKGVLTHIHQCLNGSIVLTTELGYVYSIDKKNYCRLLLKPFTAGCTIHNVYDDAKGNLWINYRGRGLRCYEWSNDSLALKEWLTKANGLPDDEIENVCFDEHNNLWASFNSGIVVFQETNKENNKDHQPFAIFYSEDLNAGDMHGNSMTKDISGHIWLAVNNKAICFFPDSINSHATAPGIQIENIKLNLLQTNWLTYIDSLAGIFSLPVNLKLPYNKNTLAFYFRAVSAAGTANASYSYMLDGFDKTWSPPSPSDFISFVNLPAGSYVFSVRTKLPDTGWSKAAVFSFEIKKAFWDTWWFRLLVMLTASALILFVFRYRMKQVKAKAELKNKMQELESKALKAQMNPHFVFNAMNSIQSLIMNNNTDQASSYVSKFAKLMRQVMENADVNLVTIEKELYSLQLYVALEKLRMHVELDYTESIDSSIDITQEKMPALILQPFVENALWHGLSKKSGLRKLTVGMTATESWITCKITDNGIGRKKAEEDYNQLPEGHLSKATAITIQRLINFNRTSVTAPVTITDLKDENGLPAGTTVIVYIRREADLA